jgi:hypothetical protein
VLEALGLVHDERSALLARALLDDDLATALELARAVADDGLDVARFTRETIDILREVLPGVLRKHAADGPHRGLAESAIAAGSGMDGRIAAAMAELAKADFRQDPSSPIPLEVACASALLGPAVGAPAPVANGVGGAPAQRQAPANRPRPDQGRSSAPGAYEATQEERFLKQLYDRCAMVDYKLAARLNGSCEVLAIDGDVLRMGFYFPLHLETMSTEGRPLLEEQAAAILGHPVTLDLKLIERQAKAKKAPRGGHLAEAALALGAKPVGKD